MASRRSIYVSHIQKVFKNARVKNYPKNQLLQYEGDSLTYIYLIKKGYVKVYTILDSGDTRTLLILGPGDVFPIDYSMNLDWEKYKVLYFYQSLTDSQLQIMESAEVKHMIQTDPNVLNTYLEYIASSNRAILNQLEVMKNKKAINKIVLLLPYLIGKLGRQIKPNVYQLRIKLSHQEVADLSGVTRETTTTLIKKLEKAGKLQQKSGRWIIKTKGEEEKHVREEFDR